VLDLPFTFGNYKYVQECYVVDMLPWHIDVFLGQDWAGDKGIVMDYGTGRECPVTYAAGAERI